MLVIYAPISEHDALATGSQYVRNERSRTGGPIGKAIRSDIKKLQTSLNKLTKLSPNLQVDGVYVPNTRVAVEALQKQLGLKVDDVAGEATQAAVAAELAKLPQ
jgi:peptidoglycan hydrolase-like protein with peptidoglycan-binding domain